MKHSESIATLAKQLKSLQYELKPIAKDKTNPFFKSNYADLESVVQGSKEALNKYGFSITQLISHSSTDSTLETVLLHESGEYISSEMRLYLSKSDSQGQGSAISYARRYAWSSIIGLVTTGEDDDGEASALATDKQISMLKAKAFNKKIKDKIQWESFIWEAIQKHPENIRKDEVDKLVKLLDTGEVE